MKESWLEASRRIIGEQLADWAEQTGLHWYEKNLTKEQKKNLIKYLSDNYPFESRSGFAYKKWRQVIREVKGSIGLIKPQNEFNYTHPDQLSLFP